MYSLLTDSHPIDRPTLVTDDVTAPMKLAVTALYPRNLQRRVAPPTTHSLTVVDAATAAVTVTAVRTLNVNTRLGFAKVRRFLKEN